VKPLVCGGTYIKSQPDSFPTGCYAVQLSRFRVTYFCNEVITTQSHQSHKHNIIFRLAGKLCPTMHHFSRCDNCLLNYDAIVSTCFLNLIKSECNHESGPEMWAMM